MRAAPPLIPLLLCGTVLTPWPAMARPWEEAVIYPVLGRQDAITTGEAGNEPADPDAQDRSADNPAADERSVDDIYRDVFGTDRPALGSDEYVVLLNGVNVGSFEVNPPPPGQDDGWIDSAFIETILMPSVVPEVQQPLRRLARTPQAGFGALREMGLDITFDQQKLVLLVSLPAQLKNRQTINLRALARAGSVTYIERADISAYLNVRAGLDILEQSDSRDTGIDRLAVALDGAVRIGPVALEASGDYDDRRAGRPWRRDDILLSYDDRSSLMRYELGDLSIGRRPLQGSPRIAGIAAFKKFSINPYLNIRPVAGRAFELEQSARVEVIVNGLPLRTLDLPSGRYRLQDFPLIPSAVNDVRLLITYPNGRVEERIFSAFYDFELLAKGRADFGINMGVPYSNSDGVREYDTGTFNMLGYYRAGLSETLTVGANIEADDTFATVGLEAIWASPVGTFALNVADDVRNPGLDSGQVTLQYRWRDTERTRDRTIDGFVQMTGADFRALDQLFGENLIAKQARIRAGQYVGNGIRAQVFAGYEEYRVDLPDSYSVGGSLTGSIGRFQLGGSMEYRRSSGRDEVVGQLSLAIRLGPTSVSANYNSRDNTMRAQFTQIEPYSIGALSAGGSIERSDRRDRQSLRLGYIGNRFEASVQQLATNFLTPSAQSSLLTEVRFGSAVVMADGAFAVSRPVTNSFAIFRNESGADYDIAVDPQSRLGGVERRYLARTDALGPAVVNNITPYYNRRIKVDAPDAAASLTNDSITLNPDYRAGFVISVETDGSVSLIGNLVDRDGDPVSLASGTYTPSGDPSDVRNFFTNRTGRFFLDGLEPGEAAQISLRGPNGYAFVINVPPGSSGMVPLDDPVAIDIDVPPPDTLSPAAPAQTETPTLAEE